MTVLDRKIATLGLVVLMASVLSTAVAQASVTYKVVSQNYLQAVSPFTQAMHLEVEFEVAEFLPANTRFTFAELFQRPGFAGVRINDGVASYTTTILNPESSVTTGPTAFSPFSDFFVGGDSPDAAIHQFSIDRVCDTQVVGPDGGFAIADVFDGCTFAAVPEPALASSLWIILAGCVRRCRRQSV